MSKKVVIILLSMVSLYSCTTFSGNRKDFVINNIFSRQKIVLTSDSDADGLNLVVKGELDGNAILKISNSNKVIHEIKLKKGLIYTNWKTSDWFEDECNIEYIPENVLSGNIKLSYAFSF